ncbi:hypothetical protein LWC34_25435 [Kibdelosporangium philippinense]|uniref:TetR family transcriptional regulator n=1 Tax=Kibdelosporangium philippinense TaxID=211113 RepID=A0ABS8ZEA6_9PSEU|nr:hypothetical protein [Kibdelosporangium philippinense]MCE7006154.1 hypothetical protein [Kibdelosporangium philippinense]
MDPNSEQPQRIIEAASQALASMHAGEDTAAVERMTAFAEDRGRDEATELMLMLFRECSAMVATLGSGGTAPVKMQVYDDDGKEVPIDEADPPVRTAVRTLLAEVHGDTEAAKDQIEIALVNAAPAEVAMVMMQALRWTIKLAAECTSRDLPVAEWITEALS